MARDLRFTGSTDRAASTTGARGPNFMHPRPAPYLSPLHPRADVCTSHAQPGIAEPAAASPSGVCPRTSASVKGTGLEGMGPRTSDPARGAAPEETCRTSATARSAGLEGAGTLEVARVAGESVAIGCRSATPLRLLLPRARGSTVWAVAASHGGGLVGGDRVALDLVVGESAQACVTTQAETKVYRSALTGRQETRARVEAGGLLALLPEPVSAFAGSAYAQAQRFDLAPSASLVLVDAFTSGRSARGERWAFRSFSTRNEVVVDGRLVLLDALRLDAAEGPPVAVRMAGVALFATVVLLGPRVAAAAAALLAELSTRPAERAPVLVAASPLPSRAARGGGDPGTSPLPSRAARGGGDPGTSPLPSRAAQPDLADGLHLRLAAADVEAGLAALRGHLSFLPALLGEDPLSRRP